MTAMTLASFPEWGTRPPGARFSRRRHARVRPYVTRLFAERATHDLDLLERVLVGLTGQSAHVWQLSSGATAVWAPRGADTNATDTDPTIPFPAVI